MTQSPASNFPNGISTSDLQSLLKSVGNQSKDTSPTWGDMTEQEINALAEKTIEDLIEKCPNPMVHKVVALRIIAGFMYWHDNMAKEALEIDDRETAQSMLVDFGALRAAFSALQSVEVDDEDFTLNNN